MFKTGQLTQESYQAYKAMADTDLQRAITSLEADNNVSGEALALAKSKVLNIPYVNLEDKAIQSGILKILPEDLSQNYQMLVFGQNGAELQVGMVNPLNYKAVEAIEFLARKNNWRLKYFIISPLSF